MILQLTIFIEEPDCKKENLPVYQGGSHVSRTALRDCVKRLVTSVTSGRKCGELLEVLALNGSWLRTYQGCCQVSMAGFSDEFSGTWPQWGTMRDGECFRLSTQAWTTSAKEFALLPTPNASDGETWLRVGKNAIKTMRMIFQKKGNPSKHLMYLNMLYKRSPDQTANFYETMMGFPAHWTDLNVSETP